MIIFVKVEEKNYVIETDPNSLISQVKDQVHDKTGIPINQFYLQLTSRALPEEKTLKSQNIHPNQTLELNMRILGGSALCSSLSFNSLQNQVTGHFSSTPLPSFRKAQPGFNIWGKCRNEFCVAYLDWVIVPKGFGNFNMNIQANSLQCTECNSLLGNVDNCVFYQCSWGGFGYQKGKKVEIPYGSHTEKETYTTFRNSDEDLRTWDYLEIQVHKLK